MSNQRKLDQLLLVDQRVFQHLLIAKENFHRLPFGKRQIFQLQLEIQINLYKARRSAIFKQSQVKQVGYKKLYAWLVEKWASKSTTGIGALPLIPLAVIAATALSGTTITSIYLTNKQKAEAQLKQTEKLLKGMEGKDPAIAAEIAKRLNQTSTSSNGGSTILKMVTGALAVITVAAVAKNLKSNG